jgi:hypothetical protein
MNTELQLIIYRMGSNSVYTVLVITLGRGHMCSCLVFCYLEGGGGAVAGWQGNSSGCFKEEKIALPLMKIEHWFLS